MILTPPYPIYPPGRLPYIPAYWTIRNAVTRRSLGHIGVSPIGTKTRRNESSMERKRKFAAWSIITKHTVPIISKAAFSLMSWRADIGYTCMCRLLHIACQEFCGPELNAVFGFSDRLTCRVCVGASMPPIVHLCPRMHSRKSPICTSSRDVPPAKPKKNCRNKSQSRRYVWRIRLD